MSEINDEFMEAFKHLDKICREMFHAERGITTYINEMERIPNGSGVVSNWNSTLRRLKELRHIRNQYSHEIGTSYTELCTWEDVDWLNVFYEDILNTRDPLAQYRSAMAFRARRTNTTKQVAAPTKRQVTPRNRAKRECTEIYRYNIGGVFYYFYSYCNWNYVVSSLVNLFRDEKIDSCKTYIACDKSRKGVIPWHH